jgi:hypothetical protein
MNVPCFAMLRMAVAAKVSVQRTPWIDPKGGGESSTPPTFPPARLGLASGTDA